MSGRKEGGWTRGWVVDSQPSKEIDKRGKTRGLKKRLLGVQMGEQTGWVRVWQKKGMGTEIEGVEKVMKTRCNEKAMEGGV